jgi:hypothetical protein
MFFPSPAVPPFLNHAYVSHLADRRRAFHALRNAQPCWNPARNPMIRTTRGRSLEKRAPVGACAWATPADPSTGVDKQLDVLGFFV